MMKGGMTDGEGTVYHNNTREILQPPRGGKGKSGHQHFSQRRRRTEMKGR